MHHHSSHAFSLVELSIVLVILGLLTGGILTGQNLIRAAELRSVVTEFQSYQTSAMTFRDKYFALPGDMRNATDFWGSAGGSGTIGDGCESASGTGTQTCNGNGNGEVWNGGALSEYGERFTFWQHLANAGLIEGNYTGIAGTGSVSHSTRDNVPPSKLSNAMWMTLSVTNQVASSIHTAGPLGNYFFIGGTTAAASPTDPIFTPEEAWNIDTKVDDGKPQKGMVWTLYWDTCTSAATNTATDGEYLLTLSSAECALFFRNAY